MRHKLMLALVGRTVRRLACFSLLVLPLGAAEKAVNLRLSTLAPRGTSYHNQLLALGEKWRQISNGQVKLTIYPGGAQGGEADMVGLMQTGNLDAGLLTVVGLSEIERDVTALQSMPMAFRSLAEVDYVGDKLRPQLERKMAAKGYVVLFWSDSGLVRWFSKSPVTHPDDLRKQKVFTWAGSPREPDAWKAARFHPVPLETAGIPQGLLSDTVEAVAMPPFFALAGQLDLQAKYMLEINWAPLVGAAVVRAKSWERVPPAFREEMLKAAAEAGNKLKAAGRAENEASVVAMVKRGLVVTKPSPAVEQEWRQMIDEIIDKIRGRVVPAETWDEAQRLLTEYRAGKGGQ